MIIVAGLDTQSRCKKSNKNKNQNKNQEYESQNMLPLMDFT